MVSIGHLYSRSIPTQGHLQLNTSSLRIRNSPLDLTNAVTVAGKPGSKLNHDPVSVGQVHVYTGKEKQGTTSYSFVH